MLDVTYGGADNSLSRPTSLCILFDGENISFDASLVIQGGARKTGPPSRRPTWA